MRQKIIIILSFFLFTKIIFADSPITSTNFYKAYLDIPIVRQARHSKIITPKIAAFLLNETSPIDQKMAVINAISWNFNGKNNSKIFLKFAKQKYNTKLTNENLINSKLKADELLVLGYLKVMDNYFNPKEAEPILKLAVEKNKKNSYTFKIILSLTLAQKAMESNWCETWRIVNKVFQNNKLNMDLRPQAITIIKKYMINCKSSCNTKH